MEVERAISSFQSLDINRKTPDSPRVPAGKKSSRASCTNNNNASLHSHCKEQPQPSEEEVLRELSRINGDINKMSEEELQAELKTLGLNTGGVKEILKKRLKNYHKRQRISQSKRLQREVEKTPYDYLIVIDYEATCGESNDEFVHEIIEFPAVLINVRTCTTVDVFQRFCKPKVNPQLTDFCTQLTGITQSQVDEAEDFTDVLKEFLDWMKSFGLGTKKMFAIVTDGPWDMARFLKIQTELSEIKFPSWAKKWINLRKCFSGFYNMRRMPLQAMLDELDMTFQGRPHCGLDDARNIAAIAVCLLQDGCVFKYNEFLHEHKNLSLSSRARPAHRPNNKSGGGHCSRTRQKKEKSPLSSRIVQEGVNTDDLLFLAQLQQKS